MTITAWSKSQDPVIPQKGAPRPFLPPFVIGLVGSLLLHGLVLQSVVLGTRAHLISAREVEEQGSSLERHEAKPVEALVFVDLPKTTKTTDEIDQALALIRAIIENNPIPITQPDPSPPRDVEVLALSEDKDSQSSVDTGDGAERARLLGIYFRQIQARVERVWRRPRTPVNDGSDSTETNSSVGYFRCQVQIVQDSNGRVQEILLPNCNGSTAWQRSLVSAIQQASPLPAPPSTSVFSHSIMLNFLGLAYVAGSPDEDYEIVSTETAQTRSTLPAGSPFN